MSLPRLSRYVLRSQAYSPSRDSDHGIRDSRRVAVGPRQHRAHPQQPDLVQHEPGFGRHRRQPVDRRLRFLHVGSAPAQQRLHQAADGGPAFRPPEANSISTAARESSIAPSRSPARIFSLAKMVSTIAVAIMVKRSCTAASRAAASRRNPRRVSREPCREDMPRTYRAQASVKLSPDRSAISSSSAVSCSAAASGTTRRWGR